MACAACHGQLGQGTNNDYFPRLAGKPAGYLYNQLVAFRIGRRKYAPMNYLLEYLPDAYLRKMAEYFAAQQPPLPRTQAAVSQEVLAHGQSLVANGALDRGVPACSNCHGPSLTGMEPAIPGPAWPAPELYHGAARRVALRHAHGRGTGLHAGRGWTLDRGDVTAVAAWLSSLRVPADPSPVPQGSLPMPLPCGSEPQ